MTAEEERVATSRAFSAYGRPLQMATSFRYLGRVILVADDNWTEVVWDLATGEDGVEEDDEDPQ